MWFKVICFVSLGKCSPMRKLLPLLSFLIVSHNSLCQTVARRVDSTFTHFSAVAHGEKGVTVDSTYDDLTFIYNQKPVPMGYYADTKYRKSTDNLWFVHFTVFFDRKVIFYSYCYTPRKEYFHSHVNEDIADILQGK